ncbi:MAG: hypothetical protein FH756_01545 [Firmicutes bacterium]|nr:hypothetical protein [Bacillota bacterium]
MNFNITGMDEFRRNLRRLGDQAADKMEAAVKSGALVVQNDAKQRAPYKTGTLRRSIHIETEEKSQDKVTVAVGTDVEYAAIHEFGGVIQPKNANKLHFKIDGKDIFADKVHIPARPYLRPALDENEDGIMREIAQTIRQLLG